MWIELEQPFLGERREELDREERIAASLLVYEFRQRMSRIPLAAQSIGDELVNIVEPKGRQHNFLHPRAGRVDRLQRPHERLRRTDFVVAVATNALPLPTVRT